MPNDIRTQAIVLRRTNYGESDRILNFLTPEGKISALARGVRKERSRLAGSIELFSVADIVVHQGRSNLAILTGAKMLRFYSNIMTSLPRLEQASECLRLAERAADQADNPEYFSIVDQSLAELNKTTSIELIKLWYDLRLLQASGEDINLINDVSGLDLDPQLTYFWDASESALRPHPQGNISASEIKLARLILTQPLATITKVQGAAACVSALLSIARK